jgi:bifunctional ADP-heptose synthase (sugar kinase/adenylyltransferase)
MADLPVPSTPMLVVGDIMCDRYVWGDVERISPEAPVQVLRWEREADKPGGAANAALNLAALGCRVRLVGVLGEDEPARWLLRTLKRAGIDTTGIVRSEDRSSRYLVKFHPGCSPAGPGRAAIAANSAFALGPVTWLLAAMGKLTP